MTYKGKIFEIAFPPSKSAAHKTQLALAISEPDADKDIEWLLIVKKRDGIGRGGIVIAADAVLSGALSYGSIVSLAKCYPLPKTVIIKEQASVSDALLEKVLRARAINAAVKHYEVKHIKKVFSAGDRIPYAGRVFDEKEITNLVDSSLDFWLTTGRYAERFEKEFAEFLGIKHCSLVNSGSSANLLAFMALTSPKLGDRRIKRGDEIITVATGFPTTVAPIIQYGAVPVFVDVALPSYNIDCAQLDLALSDKTKAVMLAHTLGNPFDLKRVRTFCDQHHLWLIEDNCDALGSRYKYNGAWRYTGTIGDIGTSSFYPPHHMTMGEGGAVYTNDTSLKRLVESFRDWGRDCWCASGHDNTCSRRFEQQFGELPQGYDHKYVYSHFGYNLKVTDMQAAVGCAQLEKLPGFIAARKRNWQLLVDGLSGLSDNFILPKPAANSDPSWFGFLLTVKEKAGISRERIVNHLETKGIQTRMLFAGNLIKHPCFDDMRKEHQGYRIVGELTNTDRIMRDTFWVGVYPGMTDVMLEYMIQTIREAVGEKRNRSLPAKHPASLGSYGRTGAK